MNISIKAFLIMAMMAMPASLAAEWGGMHKGMEYEKSRMGPDSYYEFCNSCGTYHQHGKYMNRISSPEDARAKFEKYISRHLKGFEITKMEKSEARRGTMYWVVVKDSSGNLLELHMNPWGTIKGPFIP